VIVFLPPPEPVILFRSPLRKQEHPVTQPRFSNPSPTTDLHTGADGVIHVMNAVTAAKKDISHMTTLIPEEQTEKTPSTPKKKDGVSKRRARVAPSKPKPDRKAHSRAMFRRRQSLLRRQASFNNPRARDADVFYIGSASRREPA